MQTQRVHEMGEELFGMRFKSGDNFSFLVNGVIHEGIFQEFTYSLGTIWIWFKEFTPYQNTRCYYHDEISQLCFVK